MLKLLPIVIVFLVSSCATVRVVKSQPGKGGVLAVNDGLFGEPASDKAARVMTGNCPTGYRIVEEGEAVIGQVTTNSSNTSSKGNQVFGDKSESSTSGSSETSQKTEWRVTYKCKKSKRAVTVQNEE